MNLTVLRGALGYALLTPEALLRPFVAALLAVGCGALAFRLSAAYIAAPHVRVLPAVFLAALLYLPLALRFGAVQREDLLSLPFGGGLCSLLSRFHLLKEVENHDERRKINGAFAKERV